MTQDGFAFRAVQLDLARQMETVAFVEQFAADAARLGYTTLFLYLEGRVRTKSFALPKTESYSETQIAQMVAAAQKAGLECLPATATLAHAEHFFQSGEWKAIAEERDGKARFGTTRLETFCPSCANTYVFLEKYLGELAPLFPGNNLHVGCDEAFNLGYCSLCEPKRKDPKVGLAELFVEHLLKLHAICKNLGRRMWIWDDMFELFPTAVERLPRDIVLCHWNYDPAVEIAGSRSHFANRERRDWLGLYERLGFDTVFCPASYELRNIETITAQARRHTVLGGLLTQWEMQSTQHGEYAAAVAYAGRLWSAPAAADAQVVQQTALAEMLPGAPAGVIAAVRMLCSGTRKTVPPFSGWCTGPLTPAEETQRQTTRTALTLLQSARKAWTNPPVSGLAVLDELDYCAQLRGWCWDVQALLAGISDLKRTAAETAVLQARAAAVQTGLVALIANRTGVHEKNRPGMFPAAVDVKQLRQWETDLAPIWARLEKPIPATAAVLALRLALIDFHGAPRCAVAVSVGGKWHEVFRGGLKTPDVYGTPFFTSRIGFDLPADTCDVTALRVEGWGYGGIGLAFAELHTAAATWRPARIRAQTGVIEHADAVLRDDSRFAQLGERDYQAAMLDPAVAERRGTVEILLTRDE